MERLMKGRVKIHIQVNQNFRTMKKAFSVYVVFFVAIIHSCMIGPQYKLSEKEEEAISIIEKDCSCNVRIEGDADYIPNEEKTKSFWLSLKYSKENLNCGNLDSLKVKSKYYSELFYRKADKFEEYHDTIAILFISSHISGGGEFIDCWERFSYPLDSLK